MQIHLARNGEKLAPQEEETIPALLESGAVRASDLFWHEGMADWATVGTKWSALVAAGDAPPLLSPTGGQVPTSLPVVAAPINRELIVQENPQILNAANWFWWIAGLSLINSISIHSGANFGFFIGLGFTMIADAGFHNLMIVAFVIDFLAIGFFFGAGWFARQGHFWAFVVGTVAYAADALIYVFVSEWLSVLFHAFAIYQLVRGAMALREATRQTA